MKAVGAKVLLIVLQLWTCLIQANSAGDFNCLFINYGEPVGYTAIFLPSLNVGQHLTGKSDSSVNSASFFSIHLHKIPNDLFKKFKNIQRLSVEVSQLNILDRNSLKGANNLVELYAKGNAITRLEADTFVDSVKLRIINLHDNSIKFVDGNAFRELDRLEELYLSKNIIDLLHKDTFSDLLNLKDVWLYQNKIEELPEGLFRNNLKLKKIDLTINKIKVIPAYLFKNLNNLDLVNLEFNLCISKTFTKGYLPLSTLNNEIRTCTQDNTLESNNQKLTNELKNFNDLIKNNNQQISTLQNEIMNTRKTISLSLTSITKLQEEIENFKEKMKTSENANKECLSEQMNLKSTTEICSNNLANMTETNSHLEVNIVGLSKTILTNSNKTCNICIELCGSLEEAAKTKQIIANQFSNPQRCKKI